MFFTPSISCSSASFVERPLVLGCEEGSRWALFGQAACQRRCGPSQKKVQRRNAVKKSFSIQFRRKEEVLKLKKRRV